MESILGELNHVAIVVPDLDTAARRYRDIFGAPVSAPLPLPDHGVTTVFVELSNTKIELLHPLGDESPVAAFLARHPAGGIHHLCYEVDDLGGARDRLVQAGARVLGRTGNRSCSCTRRISTGHSSNWNSADVGARPGGGVLHRLVAAVLHAAAGGNRTVPGARAGAGSGRARATPAGSEGAAGYRGGGRGDRPRACRGAAGLDFVVVSARDGGSRRPGVGLTMRSRSFSGRLHVRRAGLGAGRAVAVSSRRRSSWDRRRPLTPAHQRDGTRTMRGACRSSERASAFRVPGAFATFPAKDDPAGALRRCAFRPWGG